RALTASTQPLDVHPCQSGQTKLQAPPSPTEASVAEEKQTERACPPARPTPQSVSVEQRPGTFWHPSADTWDARNATRVTVESTARPWPRCSGITTSLKTEPSSRRRPARPRQSRERQG